MFSTNILKVAFVDSAPPYKNILNRHWSFRYDCLFANCFTSFALYFFNSPLSSCCSTSSASVFDTFRYLILFLLVVLFLLFLLVSLLLILPSHVTHRIRWLWVQFVSVCMHPYEFFWLCCACMDGCVCMRITVCLSRRNLGLRRRAFNYLGHYSESWKRHVAN